MSGGFDNHWGHLPDPEMKVQRIEDYVEFTPERRKKLDKAWKKNKKTYSNTV